MPRNATVRHQEDAARARSPAACLPRMETELAAVEREALVQARAFAEAGLAAERTVRLAAEQELQMLVEEMEVSHAVLENSACA